MDREDDKNANAKLLAVDADGDDEEKSESTSTSESGDSSSESDSEEEAGSGSGKPHVDMALIRKTNYISIHYRTGDISFDPKRHGNSFELFLIKVPCVIALHFHLTPEVESSMIIMKYANQ